MPASAAGSACDPTRSASGCLVRQRCARRRAGYRGDSPFRVDTDWLGGPVLSHGRDRHKRAYRRGLGVAQAWLPLPDWHHRSDEQVKFAPFPGDRHPAAGHALPDLPPHRRVPAREGQRGPDRALPPGPSRSARPPFPVAGRGDPRTVRRCRRGRLPARDDLAAGLGRRTPAVTPRVRSRRSWEHCPLP
jgi:hypothetical protein